MHMCNNNWVFKPLQDGIEAILVLALRLYYASLMFLFILKQHLDNNGLNNLGKKESTTVWNDKMVGLQVLICRKCLCFSNQYVIYMRIILASAPALRMLFINAWLHHIHDVIILCICD